MNFSPRSCGLRSSVGLWFFSSTGRTKKKLIAGMYYHTRKNSASVAAMELGMASRWWRVVALAVALLVFSPILCSAWSDNREFVEQQGNSSFMCKSSGPCVACSRPEKEGNKLHCRTSGYHQPFKCLEIKSTDKTEENKKHVDGDRTSSEASGTSEGRNLAEKPAFKIEGGSKTYLTYKSCAPAELSKLADPEHKFTVLQFEAIAFASFALCSPLVYYRRKHSFSGMTRLPTTNPRF